MLKLRMLSDRTVYLSRHDKAVEKFMNKHYKIHSERRWLVPENFEAPRGVELIRVATKNAKPALQTNLSPEKSFTGPTPPPASSKGRTRSSMSNPKDDSTNKKKLVDPAKPAEATDKE